jgi:hypothetical protein
MARKSIKAVQDRNEKIRDKFWIIAKSQPNLTSSAIIKLLADDVEFGITERTVRRIVYGN